MNKILFSKCALSISLIIFNVRINAGQNLNSQSTLKAILRRDNSFVSYNDSLSKKQIIPTIVANKIAAIYKKHSKDPYADKNLNPIIFKVCYNDSVDIYVAKVYSVGSAVYKFLAFNHYSRQVGKYPISIYGGFMENSEGGFNQEYRYCLILIYTLKT